MAFTIKGFADVNAHTRRRIYSPPYLFLTRRLRVHLACHAHLHFDHPIKRGFYLHDGTLDLSVIIWRSLKNKDLDFPSAGQAATG
ncbi:hypothetical protein RSAG8_09050, partial [Rhizoctonia solani AG-8 WAC10335]